MLVLPITWNAESRLYSLLKVDCDNIGMGKKITLYNTRLFNILENVLLRGNITKREIWECKNMETI